MGRGAVKRTDDQEFAEAMSEQRHVVVKVFEDIDSMKIGALRHYAKEHGVPLERSDKAVDIKQKIRAATSYKRGVNNGCRPVSN